MKRVVCFLPILLLTMSFTESLQDGGSDMCKAYIPLEKGTVLEYKDYDKKDKLNSTQLITIKDVVETANSVKVDVHSEIRGKKEDDKYESEYSYSCEDGVFKMNMEAFVNPEMTESFKDMEIKIEQENLTFPADMEVGQSLPDAHMTMEVLNNGIKMMTMNFDIINRKVEVLETMETEAGSFECLKMSFTTISKMGFVTTEIGVIEWIAPNVGVVRSENYDKKGNLEGYRVLSKISKG